MAAIIVSLGLSRMAPERLVVLDNFPVESRQTAPQVEHLSEIFKALDENLALDGSSCGFKRAQALSEPGRKLQRSQKTTRLRSGLGCGQG